MTVLRGRIVSDGSLIPDGVVVTDCDLITWVGTAADFTGELPPASSNLITAGLIDLHCHGGGGLGFPDGDTEDCLAVARHHGARGTTDVMASLVSAQPDVLIRQIERIKPLVREGVIPGIHLEGPFIAKSRCGAQDPAAIIEGDPALLEKLLEAGEGTIASMTLAPEIPGFTGLMEVLGRYGVIPSFGHTDAGSETVRDAITKYHSQHQLTATHLFNAMGPFSHREPGAVAACLAAAAQSEMAVELIADGVHLAPDTVATVFDVAAPGQVLLVSDAMGAAGMPDGRYLLGRLEVDVAGGVSRLTDGGAIAGGTSHLFDIVRHTITVAGVDTALAVTAATATPARVLRREHEIGDLRAGLRADVLVADQDLQLLEVYSRGHLVSTEQEQV